MRKIFRMFFTRTHDAHRTVPFAGSAQRAYKHARPELSMKLTPSEVDHDIGAAALDTLDQLLLELGRRLDVHLPAKRDLALA